MIYAGIDAGSRAIKIVLLDGETQRTLAASSADQGVQQEERARELFQRLLKENQIDRDQIGRIVATGYGRNNVGFANTTVTEITCHAAGVRHLAPDARTIVEIGGQDSKLIRLDPGGSVRDFAMNDRCAAGCGRFLEVVADRLEVGLDRLGELADGSRAPAAISSMCVVFAESEIIGLLADGASPADIVAGVEASIASRVAAMAGRGVEAPVVFTGGVARIGGMTGQLSRRLGHPIEIIQNPEMTGALGAALLATQAANDK